MICIKRKKMIKIDLEIIKMDTTQLEELIGQIDRYVRMMCKPEPRAAKFLLYLKGELMKIVVEEHMK